MDHDDETVFKGRGADKPLSLEDMKSLRRGNKIMYATYMKMQSMHDWTYRAEYALQELCSNVADFDKELIREIKTLEENTPDV